MENNGIKKNIEYVSFFKRAIIYFVDILILLVPMAFLYRNTYFLAMEHQSSLILLSKWIILFGFNITCLVLFGGTIGKLIFKVRVVNANGRYPTILQALIRYSPLMVSAVFALCKEIISTGIGPLYEILANNALFINIFSILVSLLIIFDGVSTFFNKERRALHDFMANTYVVVKNNREL